MIARYTRDAMGKIWAEDSRFRYMLQVEVAVAKAQAKLKIIPAAAASDIAKKSKYKIERIHEIEQTTKHDVIAFVSAVAENVGNHGKYVHYGLTSSDVLDTALSVQISEAGVLILDGVEQLRATLTKLAQKYAGALCAGRTHGMHAELTSFGYKMAGFVAELDRHGERLRHALEGCAIGKLSGAVGTYSFLPAEVESEVCRTLELTPERVATQVVPRDRHAELFSNFALYGGFIERLAVELRHLQRNEVGEVIEGFTPGQKGSSAMPHKKNPISAENLTGVARLLRGYAVSAFENQALWHERDISHSSVERVIFPDAFILVDYATDRMNRLLKGLYVDTKRMWANTLISQGSLFSSHVLLALVRQGLSREGAYKIVQVTAHGLKPGQHLREALKKNPDVKSLLKPKDVDAIFNEKKLREQFQKRVRIALGAKRPGGRKGRSR